MIVRNNTKRSKNYNNYEYDLEFYKKYGFNKYDKYIIEDGIVKYNFNDEVIFNPVKYSHTSRYSKVGTLKELGKSYHILNKYVNYPKYEFNIFKVTNNYKDRLDKIALKYYNNETYWWVIAYFNNISDSFNIPVNTILYIPKLSIIGDLIK